MAIYNKGRTRRNLKVKMKIKGTALRPRLCVNRSSRFIYAQLIDDNSRKTLAAVDDRKFLNKEQKVSKTDKAKQVGKELALLAKKMKIEKIVFDRKGYKYHGRVKALAEGAKEGGLIF